MTLRVLMKLFAQLLGRCSPKGFVAIYGTSLTTALLIQRSLSLETTNTLTVEPMASTKIVEITDKSACAQWCPLRHFPGLVALGSKVSCLSSGNCVH